MIRFVSLLLIPFFVLGQALPHSHAGTSVAEPDGHALRPHLHLHSHDHHHGDETHHHDHADRHAGEEDLAADAQGISPAPDHDSDALYLAASEQSLTRHSQSITIEVQAADWDVFIVPYEVDTRCRYRTSDPPDPMAALPIYLLTASLRL
ncbi:hypothetical protein Pla52o_34490 [Novipirellula galeiformis]|uniref:Uncharacterized protein n=1 Tax=Novipirellula galeiformis TaxID=2528004 RepID=A0A5C6CC81_9BACT|nr:hypothetical protein [Novipirellula galeiformis]TWU22393.1 hypothetical protein Pla52o_34490 [Novipirellula galeiformis]